MTKKERYQVRYAAGIYWVLDMTQSGERYQKPVTLNESGAFLFKMWQEDCLAQEMIQALSERYLIDIYQAKEDVDDFLLKWSDS
ncbi:MAG: PqqD family protein [Clostridium sp.]|jgi:hypothetical protein|nr:PqqD family protein [Clostridium sp.]